MTGNPNGTVEISDPAVLPEKPVVSVHMNTYNHEKYIAEAIDGVISQQCDFPFELIIGEDCSLDNTRTIVMDYQRRFPHLIRILTAQNNIGAKANTLRCRQAVRGVYVAICEGDDYWTDVSKLKRQVELMLKQPEIMLACHAVNRIDANAGIVQKVQRAARKSRLLSTNEIILGDGDFIPTCSILVHRTIFDNKPVWMEQAPFGDYPLVLRATQLGRIAYQDRVMGSYRINVPGSWTVAHRQQSDIQKRYAHASAIKRIMLGFGQDLDKENTRAVNYIIRKYIFNAVIRSTGSTTEKISVLKTELSTLSYHDYIFARIALVTTRKLGRLWEMPNRIRNYLGRFWNDVSQPGF
jgi:glycosyltransferase involved in cell wall biosynthesis